MAERDDGDTTTMTTNSTPDISFSIELSSPPPRRKYAATLARCSSQNLIYSAIAMSAVGLGGAHETLGATTCQVRRSTSQPSGFHDVEQVSHKTVHKTKSVCCFVLVPNVIIIHYNYYIYTVNCLPKGINNIVLLNGYILFSISLYNIRLAIILLYKFLYELSISHDVTYIWIQYIYTAIVCIYNTTECANV